MVQWLKNPLAMEGDTGSIPSLETKIPQAVGHLSSHTTTTEPYSPRAQALQREATTMRGLRTETRESPQAAVRS